MLRDIKKKHLKYAAASLIALLVVTALIWTSVVLNYKTIYKGIFIGGFDVSGLSCDTAKGLLGRAMDDTYRDSGITLLYGEKQWQIRLNDISFGMMLEDAVNRAFETGRKGNVIQRVFNIINLGFEKKNIDIGVIYDRDKLRSILLGIKREIDTGERNATVTYKNGTLTFNKEIIGKLLDIDTNMNLVENHIVGKKFVSIRLNVTERYPAIRLEDIQMIQDNLGVYSTRFSLADSGRSHNIRLAAERLNNTLIMPGEIFSMNNALGPRTSENGYMDAPVIFKNELVQGTGGGVCQVTSTLYAAIVRTGLEVIERSHHSRPLAYIPAGQDATIAEGSLDFKFQNGTGYPVCICTVADGGMIKIIIKGKAEQPARKVRISSVILEEYRPQREEVIIDDNVPQGIKLIVKKPRKGLRVAVYREIINSNGKIIEKEKLYEDIYGPSRGKIKINALSAGLPLDQLTEMVEPDAEQ